jgi:hypothetical protein
MVKKGRPFFLERTRKINSGEGERDFKWISINKKNGCGEAG